MSGVTHAQLVEAAHNWLWCSQRHSAVVSECASAFIEQPDVIGWMRTGFSTLVECKASRADFLADRGKPFRRHPGLGMGFYRWFFVPKGLVRPDEVPAGWGLAELRGSRVFKLKKPEPQTDRDLRHEMVVLVSQIERLQAGYGMQVFGHEERPFGINEDGTWGIGYRGGWEVFSLKDSEAA